MSPAPWSVVLDFDGTITQDDVADSILNEFGGLTRRMINASYDPSVITEDWVRSMFLRVKEKPARLRRFIRETAKARDGFHEFVGRCREMNVKVEVVSGGLDLYLDLLLSDWGHDHLPTYRASSRMTKKGLLVRYSYLKGATLDAFKRNRVVLHQKAGRRVLFAGDGTSDIEAATAADAAFARSHCLRHLRARGKTVRPLRSFDAPLRLLEKECSRR